MSLTSKSKFLSKVLRHDPECIGITLEPEGWASVPEILKGLDITMTILEIIVETDKKNRYSFNEDKTKIRANQGHSTKQVQLKFKPYQYTDELLYHGTSKKGLDGIMNDGIISPMSRQYVHISKDLETAQKVGSRHGSPVVLVLDAKKMFNDNVECFESDNGVVLVKSVDAKYIKCIVTAVEPSGDIIERNG